MNASMLAERVSSARHGVENLVEVVRSFGWNILIVRKPESDADVTPSVPIQRRTTPIRAHFRPFTNQASSRPLDRWILKIIRGVSADKDSIHELEPKLVHSGAVTDVVPAIIGVIKLRAMGEAWHMKLHRFRKKRDSVSASMSVFVRRKFERLTRRDLTEGCTRSHGEDADENGNMDRTAHARPFYRRLNQSSRVRFFGVRRSVESFREKSRLLLD
jgi:hypothetical protein